MNETFAQDLMQRIEPSILNQLSKAQFIDTGYTSPKVKLPQSLLDECYNNMDIDKIKEKITARLEEEVAEKIVNKLLTEYSNDVKQIMSNTELREDLRSILRSKIKETKSLLEN